jgi:hypothetical protein
MYLILPFSGFLGILLKSDTKFVVDVYKYNFYVITTTT